MMNCLHYHASIFVKKECGKKGFSETQLEAIDTPSVFNSKPLTDEDLQHAIKLVAGQLVIEVGGIF